MISTLTFVILFIYLNWENVFYTLGEGTYIDFLDSNGHILYAVIKNLKINQHLMYKKSSYST